MNSLKVNEKALNDWNRERTIRALIVGSGCALFALLVVAGAVWFTRSTFQRAMKDVPSQEPGSIVTIARDWNRQSREDVFGALNEGDYRDCAKYMRARDEKGLAIMLKEHRAIRLTAGTRLRVLEARDGFFNARVMAVTPRDVEVYVRARDVVR